MSMLRVHSKDLHEHVVSEAGECLESGLYTDLIIRCKDGKTVHAHKLVLAAVSPYIRSLMDLGDEVVFLELPEYTKDEIESLISIIYNGSIDASVEEIRDMLTLAHSLYIPVPVSDQLNSMLGLNLTPHSTPIQPNLPSSHNILMKSMSEMPVLCPPGLPGPAPGLPGIPGMNAQALSLLQQQIFNQYALFSSLPDPPKQNIKTTFPAMSPSLHPALMSPNQNQDRENLNNQLNQIISSSFKSDTGSYVCNICDSMYTNKGNFKQHIEKHIKNGEIPGDSSQTGLDCSGTLYHCSICNSSYNHPGNFKQHMLKHEREQRGRTERNPESNHLNSVLQSAFADRVDNGDPGKIYVCHDCNRTFKHPGNFKQHMASHNRPQITSPNLSSFLKRPMPGLVKMVNGETNGNGKEEWDCPECRERFDKDVDLQVHMKTEHDIEMVIPPGHIKREEEFKEEEEIEEKHNSSFGDEEAMKALAIAAGEARLANFHCDIPGCYQSFTTEGWLLRHRQKQHADLMLPEPGPRTFTCLQCGKQFNKPSKLTQHMKTHSPESHYKYPCDICGKKFTRPQHVNRHKLLHTGERPHSCNTCDKTFAREDKLKMHVKTGCSGNDLDMSLESRDSGGHGERMVLGELEEDSIVDISSNVQVGVIG